jgi:adenylate kinase
MLLTKKVKSIFFYLFFIFVSVALTSCGNKQVVQNHLDGKLNNKQIPLYIILLGAPGSGKGTQAGLLAYKYNIPQLSTGEMLRASIKEGTKAGKEAKKFMNEGKLVSDEVINQIMSVRFKKDDCRPGFILDGYPRTLAQARALDLIIDKLPKGKLIIINLEINDNEVINRIKKRAVCAKCNTGEIDSTKFKLVCSKCNGDEVAREDDNETVAKQRLNVYREQTKPVIDYYKSRKEFNSILSLSVSKTYKFLTKFINE